MLWNPQKLYRCLVVGLFLWGVSACTVQFGLPTANLSSSSTVAATANQDFSDQLMLAIIQQDASKMQQMMGNPFMLADGQSAARELPAPVAILKVRDSYFTQNSAAAFHPHQDLTTLLGGQDPLALWGPTVKATAAIYTTGLGGSGHDEALLIIAQKADGARYWLGLLVALGGFGHQPAARSMALPTATPTALATPVANVSIAMPTLQATGPERIQFAQGATSATLQGTVQGAEQKQYLLHAVAGQTVALKTTAVAGALLLAVQGMNDGVLYKDFADDLAIDAGSWTDKLPITQDYLLTLKAGSATTDPSAYTLLVTAPTPVAATAAPPERIQFAPGAVAAFVSGKVQFPNRNEYLLRANAGQQMTLEIVSPGNLANFTVTGVNDGQLYKRLENEDRTWAGALPVTQDYVIAVVNRGATAGVKINYKFKVTLAAP